MGVKNLGEAGWSPENLKKEVQKLDREIHGIAHRIEEVTMTDKHPADRQVELDRFKGEFYSKMKDFVWAVRRWDKATGYLELPSNR
jgi:formate-dependent nitrite reductase cytochrome c552 subunit